MAIEQEPFIPEVVEISRQEFEEGLPHRWLPVQLRRGGEYPLRIVIPDSQDAYALETIMRLENVTVTDEGYIISLSHAGDDNPEARFQRAIEFNKKGTIDSKSKEGQEQVVIEDVGYLAKQAY